jgi:hypothetical protein
MILPIKIIFPQQLFYIFANTLRTATHGVADQAFRKLTINISVY